MIENALVIIISNVINYLVWRLALSRYYPLNNLCRRVEVDWSFYPEERLMLIVYGIREAPDPPFGTGMTVVYVPNNIAR